MSTLSRQLSLAAISVFLLGTLIITNKQAHASPTIEVYKSPTCGCCNAWIDHLKENGLEVKSYNTSNVTPFKIQLGVPQQLTSCHTAIVDGYAIEGHVPAQDIHRLLKERPDILGLTVPGMPVGSPGMEMGNRKDPYTVLTFDQQGKTSPFSQY